MGYFPIPVEGFGGLDLANDPGEVGFSGAIDLLNVDFDDHGRVRTRGGFGNPGATASANVDSIFPVHPNYTLVGTTTPSLQVFDSGLSSGPLVVTRVDTTTGTTQGASAAWHNFIQFGTPTTEYVYIANGTDQIRRFDPSSLTFTAPASLSAYTTRLLAVTPWDNRLVTEGTTQKSRVWFSDAGSAETFGANNFLDLIPGDGEQITAIHAWRDLLFVFKKTKFFVFYGTSTDSSGNPIFNYRTIDTGQGVDAPITAASWRAVTPGRDALYFANSNGIWRSTGGPPEKMSSQIEPLFRGRASSFATSLGGPGLDPNFIALQWVDDKLVLGARITDANLLTHLIVFDAVSGQWTVWVPPGHVRTIVAIPPSPTSLYHWLTTAVGTAFYKTGRGYSTDDAGVAITSYYQSGFESLSPPRRYIDRYGFGPSRKRVRSWRVQGTGTVTMAVAADYGSTVGSTALTLGTSPAVAEARYSRAIRGSKISYKLSGTAPWSVNDLVAMLADTRAPASDVSGDT